MCLFSFRLSLFVRCGSEMRQKKANSNIDEIFVKQPKCIFAYEIFVAAFELEIWKGTNCLKNIMRWVGGWFYAKYLWKYSHRTGECKCGWLWVLVSSELDWGGGSKVFAFGLKYAHITVVENPYLRCVHVCVRVNPFHLIEKRVKWIARWMRGIFTEL